MAGELCQRCGAPGSPAGIPASCGICRLPATLPGSAVTSAAWLSAFRRGGSLGQVLVEYRRAGRITQQQLADLLGFDRTYISMIETGRRAVADHSTLAHVARTLAIPPHLLGLAAADDADFASMLEFGHAVIRLAEVARHGGRAAAAVTELWPLIIRLQARIAAGFTEPAVIRLLAEARVELGVALGHLLPDERLATAAWWTGRALRLAWDLGDRRLLAAVLRMHGNELRKAGHPAASIVRLRQSLQVEDEPASTGAGLVLLARAASQAGQPALFDVACARSVQLLERSTGREEVLLSEFTVREVRIRGLLATGRTARAIQLAGQQSASGEPPTPQWRAIEQITTAEALASAGEQNTAAAMLAAAVTAGEALRLPHQLQRVIQLTGPAAVLASNPVGEQAAGALARVERQLAGTARP
jgi:transcriptional regulator with XRE-family HTH domain